MIDLLQIGSASLSVHVRTYHGNNSIENTW